MNAMLDATYVPAVTSRERTATSTGVLPTWQVTLVSGATVTLKDRMNSGGLVSFGFVAGLYDSLCKNRIRSSCMYCSLENDNMSF